MEPCAPRGEGQEPPAPPESRVPDWHVVTLERSHLRSDSSGSPVRGSLEIRPGDELTWQVEVTSGARVGLGLRLPAGAPVRSFGPFAALSVDVVDQGGIDRLVAINADAGDFPEPSLSFEFALVVFPGAEAPAPSPAEQTMALTEEEDPADPDTSLKIDKLSKPPDSGPGGRRKKHPFYGEGRWQKILVDATPSPGVDLWLDPDPPAAGSGS